MRINPIANLTALLTLLVAPALALTGCSKNPVTGKSELVLISPQQEIEMGREAAPQFEQEFAGKIPDESLQSYVSGVGRKVAAVSPRQDVEYEFAVLASDVVNAFALPGGKVYVTAGLMGRMTNERQLAAVLAHEVTHVAARHSVQAMQRQMGAAALAELAGMIAGQDKAQAAQAAAEIVGSLVTLSYSRDEEYQSDTYGTQFMAKAGYNPWGMVELLDILKSLQDSEPGRIGEIFQTHPLTSKRIENARGIVEKDHPAARSDEPDPNSSQFMTMRQRLTKYVK